MTAADCTAGLNKGRFGRHQPRLPLLCLEWHRRHDEVLQLCRLAAGELRSHLISVQTQHARL